MKQSKKDTSFRIKMLLNPHRYFLDNVFIVSKGDTYRLLVFSKRRGCVYNTIYPTMRGARIAFTRKWNPVSPDGTIPDWSDFFSPELNGAIDLICPEIEEPCEPQLQYQSMTAQAI